MNLSIEASIPTMALRGLYAREANSHRNMLQRQKSKGALVAPKFRSFRSFLQHLGPMPAPGYTLDRIDNADPEYAPGKVRWADKRTQNTNKGDTLTFRYSRTGDTYTTSRLADLRGVSASTIRKRRERGWTDDEIIEGKRINASPVVIHNRLTRPNPKQHKRPSHAAQYGKDVLRDDAKRRVEEDRKENGIEYFPAHPSEFLEIFSDANLFLSGNWLERAHKNFVRDKLKNYIRYEGEFVIFDRLKPQQQEWLAECDPVWVAKRRAETATRAALKELM